MFVQHAVDTALPGLIGNTYSQGTSVSRIPRCGCSSLSSARNSWDNDPPADSQTGTGLGGFQAVVCETTSRRGDTKHTCHTAKENLRTTAVIQHFFHAVSDYRTVLCCRGAQNNGCITGFLAPPHGESTIQSIMTGVHQLCKSAKLWFRVW